MTVVEAPRRALPAPELLAGAALVLVLCGAGAVHGAQHATAECTRQAVDALPVLAQNGLLALLLISGLFTFGLSTLTLGSFILATTGASIGGIVAVHGMPGVLLLAPHGLLEIASWVLATSIGLTPLTSRRSSAPAEPGRGLLLRVGLVYLLVLAAALLETVWTSFYGPRLSC